MKVMKTITALTLSAAIVPALALSSTAFAESSGDMQTGDSQSAGQQQTGGEKYMSAKPAGAHYADEVIGQTVKHRGSGEDIGEIQDLVIGEDGRIAGVVLSTGSFLGLGGQEVGLAWDQLQQTQEENESVFYVDMDEETLRNAPAHERQDENQNE